MALAIFMTRMKTKKLFAPILSVAALGVLAACDQNQRQTSSSNGDSSQHNTGKLTDRNSEGQKAGPTVPNPDRAEKVENNPNMEQRNRDEGHTGKSLEGKRFDTHE